MSEMTRDVGRVTPAERSSKSAPEPLEPVALQEASSPRGQSNEVVQRKRGGTETEETSSPRGQSAELLQRRATGSAAGDTGEIHEAAARGVAGAGGALPHGEKIQSAFGGHDVSGVKAHVGGDAATASRSMGAQAFATGSHVAFGSSPDLHTAAHEAAHVVQQRDGVQLKGGVGEVGDRYERQADAVADAVVAGRSAEGLLGTPRAGASAGAVQRSVQMNIIDDALDLGRRVITAIGEWIDLMVSKRALLKKINDTAWVKASVAGIKPKANPKHAPKLKDEITALIDTAKDEALALAKGISKCDTPKQVAALDKTVEKWRTQRKDALKKEVEAKILEYRDVEKQWLGAYVGHAPISPKGNIKPNQYQFAAQSQLKLVPGATSQVVTTTPVEFEWLLTDAAKKAKVKGWDKKGKAKFKKNMQAQLDAVWGPNNQMKPFKITQPEDFLLEKEATKWSSIVATFRGVVVEKAGQTGNNKVKAWRSAPGEGTRANSANLYEENANAQFDKSGRPKGSAQDVLAHEFGHFGMGLPDEYSETSQNSLVPTQRPGFGRAIKALDKKIAECDAIIKKSTGDTAAAKAARKKAEKDKKWYLDDKTALNNPWGTGVDLGLGSNMYRLAPQNRPAGMMAIPQEAFASYAGDLYAPGQRKVRGQRPNETQASDRQRIMIAGNRVEPYMYEGVLEQLNQAVTGQFDPEVQFEHNVKAGSEEKKVIDDVRAWNHTVDLGKAKAKAGGGAAHEAGDRTGAGGGAAPGGGPAPAPAP